MNNKRRRQAKTREHQCLANAREEPQDGENSKPFDQFFLLLYQMFNREKEYNKVKLTCQQMIKTTLSNLQFCPWSTTVKSTTVCALTSEWSIVKITL